MPEQRVGGAANRVLVLTKKKTDAKGTSSMTIKGPGGEIDDKINTSGGAIAVNMSAVQYVCWDDDHYYLHQTLV